MWRRNCLTFRKMGFTEVRVARSLVFCVVLYRSMFVLSHLAIAQSVPLQFTSYMPLLISCIVCTTSVYYLYAPFGLLYSLYIFSSLPICSFWSLVQSVHLQFTSYMLLLVSCIVCTSSVSFLYAPFGLLCSLYIFSILPICPF